MADKKAKKSKKSQATHYKLTHPNHSKEILRLIDGTPKEVYDNLVAKGYMIEVA